MPSYYDSKKKQPGKAEVKYKKGGKVKYDKGGVAHVPRTVTKSVKSKANLRQQEMQDRKKALIESLKRKSKPLPKVKLPTVTVEELDGGELEEVIVEKKSYGGKIKKMKGGGTVARGSGAARTQHFGKNG